MRDAAWPADLRDYRIEAQYYFHYNQSQKRGITREMLREYTGVDPAPYIEASTEIFKKGVAELLAQVPRDLLDWVLGKWPGVPDHSSTT